VYKNLAQNSIKTKLLGASKNSIKQMNDGKAKTGEKTEFTRSK